MNGYDWKEHVVYCRYETCGDPIPGGSDKPRYNKRQMVLSGITMWGTAEFVCPVCARKRRFKERLFGEGVYEIPKGGDTTAE